MAISLADVKRVRADLPPRLLIYGPEGMGKTTLAAEFPNPVFLQVEDGTPADTELTSFGELGSYEQIVEAIQSLIADDHDFNTVVIDSISRLEGLVFAEVCRRNNWKTIEAPGYGKGYKEADYIWNELLEGLGVLRKERRMNVVLIGHAKIDRFDDPTTSSYSRFELDLHDRAAALISREVDAILLVKQDVVVKEEDQGFNKKRAVANGGEQRWIYAEGRPGFVAKNRYGIPPKLPFTKGQGYAQLAAYLPPAGHQQAVAAKAAA